MTPGTATPSRGARPSSMDATAWGIAILGWLYYQAPLVQSLLRGAPPERVGIDVLAAGTGLLAVVALAWRRTHPLAVAVVVGVLWALSPAAIGAAVVAVASYSRRHGAPEVWLVAAGMLAAKVVGTLVIFPGGSATALQFETLLAVLSVVVATLVGQVRRFREQAAVEQERAEQARREAELARLAEARLAERERIAREMHDAIAHRLSLVAMHAGALAFRTRLTPEEYREAAGLIQANAQASLDELRAMLTTLRSPDGATTAPEAPQPTLDHLGVLVADAADADQRVTLDVVGDLAAVPVRISRHAFRIVQEAITNARKHAPGAPVDVRLEHNQGELRLAVSNPLADLAPRDASGAGLGLIGVDERVALLGGTARHGVQDGRFEVAVRLPIRIERPDREDPA